MLLQMARHYFVLHPMQEANIVLIWMTRNSNSKTDAQSRKRKQMYDEIDAVKDFLSSSRKKMRNCRVA